MRRRRRRGGRCPWTLLGEDEDAAVDRGEKLLAVIEADALRMAADRRRIDLQAQPEGKRVAGRDVPEDVDQATVGRTLSQRLRRLPVDRVTVGPALVEHE